MNCIFHVFVDNHSVCCLDAMREDSACNRKNRRLFNGLQNGVVAETKQTLLASIISPGELFLLISKFEGGYMILSDQIQVLGSAMSRKLARGGGCL
jgi:hypothetical protein